MLPGPLYCHGSLNDTCDVALDGTTCWKFVETLAGTLVGALAALDVKDPLRGLRLSTRGFDGIFSLCAGLVSGLAPAAKAKSVSIEFLNRAGLKNHATCTIQDQG